MNTPPLSPGKFFAVLLLLSSASLNLQAVTPAISAGGEYSLFLKSDGSVWATGENGYGQLGDGTTINRTRPQRVMTGVKAISAGRSHSLFLKTNGTVWAAGYNSDGRLGDGTFTDRLYPVQVIAGVKAISAGWGHSLFLMNDGTVSATGFNFWGQLGNGTSIRRSTPLQIPGLIAVEEISAGDSFSLFLKSDGTVWATGLNVVGVFGDGKPDNSLTPVQGILTGVETAAAGESHSLFSKADGTFWAAGWNGSGALGDGTSITRLNPVQVFLNLDPGSAWQDEQFGEDVGNPLISGWNEDPDHDGVVNLLERAFNLSPILPDRSILAPETGSVGLPLIRATEGPGGRVISIEYIRRIASTNPGLTYIPQFSSTLQDGGEGGWAEATGM